MPNSPKISVITVTYNGAKTLKRTIDSVLNQTYRPYEYLIIDGASADSTVEIARSYEDAFKKAGIKYNIVSEKDNGIYDAMNKGIAMAEGDLIGLINSDDWYEDNALETVSETYINEPFDLFYADIIMHKADGSTFVKHSKNSRIELSMYWNHPTTFITKEIYSKEHYKTETIHDDYDLILRIKKAGCKTVVKNVPIANFTMNGVSHERSFGAAMKRVKIKYGIYRNNGYSPLYFLGCFAVEMGKLIIG